MSPHMHQLHRDDWADNFPAEVLERGRLYAKQGMARLVRITPETIEARCLGSAERPYRQQLRLQVRDGKWLVSGRCSCALGRLCKHMVAVLLTVERLQQQNDPQAIPVAPAPAAVERLVSDLRPVPLLRLASHSRSHYDARSGRMREQTQHRAALSFCYGPHAIHGRFAEHFRVRLASGETLRVRRDAEAEAGWRQQLAGLGFRAALRRSEALPEDAGEPLEMTDDGGWLRFMQQALPALRKAGWRVQINPGFHYQLEPIDDWYVRIDEAADRQWFDLEMGIEVAGRRVSLLPILLNVLRHTPAVLSPRALAERAADDLLLVALPARAGESLQRVGLPYARLRPILKVLAELHFQPQDASPQSLRLNRADASRLAQLDSSPALSWIGGESLRELAAQMHGLAAHRVTPPPGLQATLRTYQLEGLAWLQGLHAIGASGILADDMGLGKTLQSLAHLLLEKQAGRLRSPALVVVPTSLISNWQEEAARFAPQLKVVVLQGPKRHGLFVDMAQADLILTSYALLARDARELGRLHYSVLLLDEAQAIKNPRSRTANAARALRADQRLCLTGTPLENHLGELWSLFHFLMPGWLGDQKGFSRDYRQPIEKHADATRLAHLTERLRPFLLRRSKEQVASELPAKTLITQWVELTELQRDRYEALRLSMDAQLRQEIASQGLAASRMLVLDTLLRLRQICCDLRLLADEPAEPADSAKLQVLLDMLQALAAEGRRVLVFSQFTRMLKLIEIELQQRGIAYALLTGATRDRAAPVRAFQSGALPVFLISLKAGGAGLNLTAADTVIHFDPWWNPAVEAQASDRAHRIGQDKPVFIYRLITRGSVEEKMQQLQRSKAALASAVLGDRGPVDTGLSPEDLDLLLGPLS